MKNSPIFRRLFLITTLFVLSAVITVAVYTDASKSQKKQGHERTYDAAKVTTQPQVVSGIKGLEISGVSLINQGTPEAALSIDVTNRRDEDLMALDFVAGKGTNSGLLFDGLLQEDNPLVIIPHNSLKTFTWNLGSIMEGETIYIVAAVFADGKEEGDKHFLAGIKKTRLQFQERRRQQKAKNGGQQ